LLLKLLTELSELLLTQKDLTNRLMEIVLMLKDKNIILQVNVVLLLVQVTMYPEQMLAH
jgi:hypothetical protein